MFKFLLNLSGAFVLSAGCFYGSGVVANILMPETKLMKSAIVIDETPTPPVSKPTMVTSKSVVTTTSSVSTTQAPTPPKSLNELLASADVTNGQKLFMSLGCIACHSFNDGGKNGLGPNLYGVFGKQQASHEGYQYSAALSGKKGTWTADELNLWLTKPSAYASGTKMSYAGLPDETKRADIIVYLNSLSATPLPLK